MKNIIIIPARRESKRFPGKNRSKLNGIPLVMYSINYARKNSSHNDKIVVTTDDPEVKQIALEAGVEVVDRPTHLCTDTATTVSALKHVLEVLKDNFRDVILFQPTNPLRPSDLFKEAYKKYKTGNYDSLMTVTRSLRKLGKIAHERFIPYNYHMGQRSQEMEPLYYENGLLYIAKAEIVLKERLLGDKNYPFIVAHPYAKVDIDTKEDSEYAEFLLSKSLE